MSANISGVSIRHIAVDDLIEAEDDEDATGHIPEGRVMAHDIGELFLQEMGGVGDRQHRDR